MKSSRWYVSDFETTSERYYNEHGYTKVWLWSLCDQEANITQDGTDIESFITYIRQLCGGTIYFHNLKFDGTFIVDYLLNNGWKYVDKLDKDDTHAFTTLIDDAGAWYSIDIRYSKNRTIHIHDSLKLLPFKVAKIAKDFNLPILKGRIDYDDYTVSDESISYIHNDVRIVAMALKQIKDGGMTKMTTASCAYNQYTSMRPIDYLQLCYPDLDTSFLNEWRKAYRGGRSQVSPLYQGKILTGVRRYDINSMYPYIMRHMPLPYGYPIPITSEGQYKFELLHVRIGFVLKKGHLPSLLRKSAYFNGNDSYYIQTESVEEMWISNIDLELVRRNYDVYDYQLIDGWGFRCSTLLFSDYVDKWYGKKQIDSGARKIVDKLMLNSLYGKFGSNVMRRKKVPKLVDDKIKYDLSEEEEGKHYYLPVAIAITSYAHRLLDDAIHETGLDKFVYCDTDSVHTLGTLPDEWVDSKELGKFKLEAVESKSKYVRQKCYVYEDDDGITITCAGMPEDQKEGVIQQAGSAIWHLFDVGMKVGGKLMPLRVKGGTILHETTFEIKQ